MITEKQTDEALCRFNHHPDPAIDFCVEVEKLESRLHQAELGLSKPGMQPETVKAVYADICRAMDFTVGGDAGAVDAKAVLRDLARRATPADDLRAALLRWCGERQRDVLGCVELNAQEEAAAIMWLNNFRAALSQKGGA